MSYNISYTLFIVKISTSVVFATLSQHWKNLPINYDDINVSKYTLLFCNFRFT